MDITTIKVYTEVGEQLIRYIFRSKDIKPEKRLIYELTKRQQMCIKDVWTSIKEQVGDSESREEEEEESDKEIKWMSRIQQKILRL